MPSPVRTLTAAAVALALVAVPTGSIAASTVAAPQPTAQQAVAAASTNPWLTLSAMTGSSSSAAAAMAASTAAQDEDDPDFPPVAPLVVMLGTITLGVWILLHDNDGHKGGDRGVRGPNGFGEAFFPGQQFAPVSPA